MKKIIAFLFVCGFAVAVVSCGQKTETSEGSADTTTVVEPAPVVADTTSADTTTVGADTTVAK